MKKYFPKDKILGQQAAYYTGGKNYSRVESSV